MKPKTSLAAAIVLLALLGLAIIGWIMNIVTIIAISGEPITGMFIIRCIGVIVGPVGAVLGWF